MQLLQPAELPSHPPARRELQKLSSTHYTIMELVLLGMSNKDIASKLNRSEVGIGLIVRDPHFQQELSRRRQQQQRGIDEATAVDYANVQRVLEDGAITAANKMVELIDHSDPKIAQTSAKDILDRTYGRGSESGNSGGLTVNLLSVEKLQLLQVALQETKQLQNGLLQDGIMPLEDVVNVNVDS